MYIIDESRNASIKRVTLVLKPSEATELASALQQLLKEKDKPRNHCHISNATYQKEITVCLINDDISSFHPDIRKLMEKELDE